MTLFPETIDFPKSANPSEPLDHHKEMMRVMAECSFNIANVVPSKQEELASFMVKQLR